LPWSAGELAYALATPPARWFYDLTAAGTARGLRNDLSGALAGEVQFVQSHSVAPAGNDAQELPRPVALREALLLVLTDGKPASADPVKDKMLVTARRNGVILGGQQQRVGIARAFMLDPDVVLADEPVASLDPRISHDIMSLIREVATQRERSVLCSLHQVNHAREFADRIVALRDGRVVFDDAPQMFTDAIARQLYGPNGSTAMNAASTTHQDLLEHDSTATDTNSSLELAA
jgi:ABC-type glutathione transport system ATPase component